MSFLSNLFTRKEKRYTVKTVQLPSEIAEVINEQPGNLIEPTKEGPSEKVPSELVLASWVKELREKGKFNKDYQAVHEFLVNTDAEKRALPIKGNKNWTPDEITEEMRIFIKKYQFRKLKCSDEEFQSWITNVKL